MVSHLQNDDQVSLLRCFGGAKNRAGCELLAFVFFSRMYYECNVHIPIRRELAEFVQRHILERETHTRKKRKIHRLIISWGDVSKRKMFSP